MVEDIAVVCDNVAVVFAFDDDKPVVWNAAVVEVTAEVEYTILVQDAGEVGYTKVEKQVAVLAVVVAVTALLPSTHLKT